MGKISIINYPNQTLEVTFPRVTDVITIDIYDDVEGLTLTNKSNNYGFSTGVSDNEKKLSSLIQETGYFEIEIHTNSGGIYTKEIEILFLDTTIIFNKINYDFEIKRVNEECQKIENDGTNLLSTSFISTDIVKLQFRELKNYDLLKDGFSFDDIIWETKGLTENDGTVDLEESGDNAIHSFTPNPINRPTERPVRTRNLAISYKTSITIIGLKKEFTLEQDQVDILRQEYVDFGITFQPQRSNVYRDNGAWNVGNYDYIVTESDDNHFQTIYDAIVSNWEAKGYTDGITVSSAYRNPRRNPGVINSRHLRGLALDIYPQGVITLQRWLDLRTSGNEVTEVNGVNAHCDRSGTFVDDNCSLANHIHVQW
ncbi:hypothetical protein A8C32_01290 [Flavivirga aquatica]|uniref:Uncharacterized protein n=1 Tax=Flavivirga aquatica TaxID=1849968 RepID=A0A1E5T9R8_9FLAO|nr:D-Ala-D-Ala carboxypeptidase family metallohydrolase [Flavivirga aquatica]OEK08123.1 hypothetical protein A8C32_01290 [Flavivirga aquatica]